MSLQKQKEVANNLYTTVGDPDKCFQCNSETVGFVHFPSIYGVIVKGPSAPMERRAACYKCMKKVVKPLEEIHRLFVLQNDDPSKCFLCSKDSSDVIYRPSIDVITKKGLDHDLKSYRVCSKCYRRNVKGNQPLTIDLG